jgi:hypothetical protein
VNLVSLVKKIVGVKENESGLNSAARIQGPENSRQQAADSGQRAVGRRQKADDRGQEYRSQRKEERDSPVGAAFSRDLAL